MRVEPVGGTRQVTRGTWQAQPEGDGGPIIKEIGRHTLAGSKVVGEGKAPVVVGAGGGDRVHHEQCAVAGLAGNSNHGNAAGIAGTGGGAVPVVGVVVVVPGSVQGRGSTAGGGITLKEVIPPAAGRQVVLGKTGRNQKEGCRE